MSSWEEIRLSSVYFRATLPMASTVDETPASASLTPSAPWAAATRTTAVSGTTLIVPCPATVIVRMAETLLP